MTNLTATPGWDNIYQLETVDRILGGPGGIANAQAQALLNRTEKLKADLDLKADIALTAPVVASIAALRLLPKTGAPRSFVLSYYGDGEGGGGPYQYDAADTTSADNGGTIIVAADGGRWKLVYDGVVSVAQFGAREGGVDAQPAIQACVNALVAANKPVKMGLWGDWSIGNPIVFPACRNIVIEGGRLSHLPTFPTTGYSLEFNSTTARSNELVHIDAVWIECNSRGGGIKLDNGFKAVLSRCHVQHFKTRGYWIKESSGAHEVFLNHCWAMEYVYADGAVAYNGPWYGTGVDVEPNDCKIDGLVCYFTGTPLRVDSQYNIVTNSHIGTGTILFTSNSSFCRFSDNYVDMGMLLIENPWHIKVQNNQFLHATNDGTRAFVRLKPLAAGTYIYGVDISGNSFQNNSAATMHSIQVDTSAGGFTPAGVGQCVVEKNSFTNTTVRTTRQRMRLFQGPSTSYSLTADQFPFGAVQHVVASFAPVTAGVAVAQGVGVSGNTVTLTLASPTSGMAHVEVDCNID